MSFRPILMRFVSRIVPPKDIEDIVQETYIKACDVEQKNDINRPQSLFFKIAKNLALDHVKKADSRFSTTLPIEELEALITEDKEYDKTFHEVAAKEEFIMFCESVRCLPVQCRRAFILKKVYGFSQKEIAEYMNISESTVEKHIASGIKRCANFMMNASRGKRSDDPIFNSRHEFGDV